MANPIKKKKSILKEPPKKIDATIVCLSCGREKKEDEFYNTSSSLYRSHKPSKHCKLPFCKVCVNKKYEELAEKAASNQRAVYVACAMFDIPYKKAAFEMADKSDPVNFFGVYVRNINSRKEFQSLTFIDSDDISDAFMNDGAMGVYRTKWGAGFTFEEYTAMEQRYNELVEEYGEPDFVKADSYRKFILSSVVFDRDIGSTESKDRNSASANYFKALKESGLGAKEAKDITKDMTCGEIIAAFEGHSPILKNKDNEDVDGMEDVKSEIVRHIKRIFGEKEADKR